MSHGPVFVERIDYEAAVAYLEAHLPEDVRPYADRMATETIAAALVGVRPAEGSRVAGPDDLLIRREVVEAWLRMANNSEIFDLEYHLERALAAAEGEET